MKSFFFFFDNSQKDILGKNTEIRANTLAQGQEAEFHEIELICQFS
jgi:hypothetical protein